MSFSQYTQQPASVPLVSAAETVVEVSPPAPVSAPDVDSQGIVIRGYVNLTTPSTTTAIVIRCRRGTTTGGAQVGNTQTITAAAATNYSLVFSFLDANASAVDTPMQYCITVSCTGGSTTTAANDGCIEVFAPQTGGAD